jgi:hypothetical protein
MLTAPAASIAAACELLRTRLPLQHALRRGTVREDAVVDSRREKKPDDRPAS